MRKEGDDKYASLLKLNSLLIYQAALSPCQNTCVYGSVGVGSHGFNHHHSGSRKCGSISVGGRIR